MSIKQKEHKYEVNTADPQSKQQSYGGIIFKMEKTLRKHSFFWTKINDEISARYAMGLAQYAAFILVIFNILELILIINTGYGFFSPDYIPENELTLTIATYLIIDCFLLWSAWRIRNKKYGTIPFLFMLLMMNFLICLLIIPLPYALLTIPFLILIQNAFRGWLVRKKYNIDNDSKPKNIILIVITGLISIILLYFFTLAILEEYKLIPSLDVLQNEEITDRQKSILLDNDILCCGETIQYYYSDGYFNHLESGYILTDQRLIRYETVEGALEIYDMPYDTINFFEFDEEYSTFLSAGYYVYGNEFSKWQYLYIYLPVEHGDEEFINQLQKNIDNAQGLSGYP